MNVFRFNEIGITEAKVVMPGKKDTILSGTGRPACIPPCDLAKSVRYFKGERI